jgi:hypothetical protein
MTATITTAVHEPLPTLRHEMKPMRALRAADEVMAQIVQVGERLRDRQGRIAALVAEQETDQTLERRLTDSLRELLHEGHREHEMGEDAWARKVVESIKENNDRWSHRLVTVEGQLQRQQSQHHREVAELQRDWLEAVGSMRKLEAALNLQRSAADVVIQNASAVEGFLKANPTALHPIASHDAGASAGATEKSVATTAHHQQLAKHDNDYLDSQHRGQETPSEKSPEKYDAATDGDVTPGRSLAHERSPGESPSATPYRSVSLASVGLRPTTPENLGTTARPLPTISSILRNAADRLAEHEPLSPARRSSTPPPATERTSSRRSDLQVQGQALQQQPRSQSLSRTAPKPLSAAFDYGQGGNTPRQPQQQDYRSVSAGSTPQRPGTDWSNTRVPHSWTINPTGRSASADSAASKKEGDNLTLGLVLGLRRQDCHLLGIEVVRVIPGSPAHLAGIRPRSLLVELNGRRITCSQDVQNVLVDIKRREQLRNRVGDYQSTHLLIPFQCIDLPRPTEGRAYLDAEEGSSRSELELEDGRRLSWEGHLRLDVSRLAVGPFNHHKEHFAGSPTDLAPVSEVFTAADTHYW